MPEKFDNFDIIKIGLFMALMFIFANLGVALRGGIESFGKDTIGNGTVPSDGDTSDRDKIIGGSIAGVSLLAVMVLAYYAVCKACCGRKLSDEASEYLLAGDEDKSENTSDHVKRQGTLRHCC